MFKKKPESLRLTLRALAHLLRYPDAQLRSEMQQLAEALQVEQALKADRLAELVALCRQLAASDAMEAESRYVETFDRGPALIDLLQTYERAGLQFSAPELPDHLPVVLEFASTQPPEVACGFLGEMAHILTSLFSALVARESPYASVIGAILEIAGQQVQAVPVPEEPEIDDSWDEPVAFDGCSTRGQAKPGQPQPLHFVRNPRAPEGAPL